MKRTVVVHIVGQLEMGGMEKLLVEFARHTDREQFDLRFVCLGPRGILADDIEALGWTVLSFGQVRGRSLSMIIRLARLFRDYQADVVHTHNYRPLIYGAPAARLARIPRVVYTRHGQSFGATTKERRLFRFASRLVNHVVCVSADSARITLRQGIAPRRVSTILNGIDTSQFAYLGPQADGPLVAVGRTAPEKDFQTLLHAVALARAELPNLRLEIAGDGPSLPALRALANQLDINDLVTFLGQVRDVPALLAQAGAFVLPSVTEGISLTLLEAMARGLPVIATAVGGNPEVVVDEETGKLVPPQAPQALARAIIGLLRMPFAMRAQMGEAGRRRVEQSFDVRRMVAEYECLYREDARVRFAAYKDRVEPAASAAARGA